MANLKDGLLFVSTVAPNDKPFQALLVDVSGLQTVGASFETDSHVDPFVDSPFLRLCLFVGSAA